MAGSIVEPFFGDLWGRHAFVAVLEFILVGELFQFVADDRSIGQPQGQALAHFVADVEDLQLGAQFSVVAFEGFFSVSDERLEFLWVGKGQGVDSGQHGLILGPLPIGAGHPVQLERLGQVHGAFHVGAFADIRKGTMLKEAHRLGAAGLEVGDEFCLEGLVQLRHLGGRLVDGQFVLAELVVFFDLAAHLVFDGGQLVAAQLGALWKLEVVVEAVFDGRPVAELGAWIDFLNRRGHDVGQGMAKLVDLEFFGAQVAHLFFEFLGHYKRSFDVFAFFRTLMRLVPLASRINRDTLGWHKGATVTGPLLGNHWRQSVNNRLIPSGLHAK